MTVNGSLPADDRERISGKIQVRDRIKKKPVLPLHQLRKRLPVSHPQFRGGNACHRLKYQRLFFPDRHQIRGQFILEVAGLAPSLQDQLAYELLFQLRLSPQGLCHEVAEIDDLHPLAPERIRKGVVFFSRRFEVGNVVEEKPLQFFWDQMFKFFTRFVQQHFFELPDFAVDLHAVYFLSPGS